MHRFIARTFIGLAIALVTTAGQAQGATSPSHEPASTAKAVPG